MRANQELREATGGEERRVLPITAAELRLDESGDEYRLTCKPAVFRQRSGDLGGFFEEIDPGFFSKVIGGDTRFLLNHDSNFVLARQPAGTLTLKETGSALEIDARLSKTDRNRDWVVDPMRRGDITQGSFAFRVGKGGDKWEELDDGTMLRTLLPGGCSELPDVSVVTFPAYPQTSAAVRSLDRWRAEHRSNRRTLELRARALQLEATR